MAVQKNKYPITHVLVDCENVGLSGFLEIVSKTDGQLLKFILFHNKDNKLNIPLSMVDDFCNAKSDGRIECVELSLPANMTKKQAENALDFYIAYYIGTILPFSPFNSHCVILSKDKDYDPLICHVQKDFPDRCERLESYDQLKKILNLNSNSVKIQEVAKSAVVKEPVIEKNEESNIDVYKRFLKKKGWVYFPKSTLRKIYSFACAATLEKPMSRLELINQIITQKIVDLTKTQINNAVSIFARSGLIEAAGSESSGWHYKRTPLYWREIDKAMLTRMESFFDSKENVPDSTSIKQMLYGKYEEEDANSLLKEIFDKDVVNS